MIVMLKASIVIVMFNANIVIVIFKANIVIVLPVNFENVQCLVLIREAVRLAFRQ